MNNIVTSKSGLEVTQSHWNWYNSDRFLFALPSGGASYGAKGPKPPSDFAQARPPDFSVKWCFVSISKFTTPKRKTTHCKTNNHPMIRHGDMRYSCRLQPFLYTDCVTCFQTCLKLLPLINGAGLNWNYITLHKIVFRVPKITRTARKLHEIKGVMWEYSYEGKHLEKR